MLQTPENNLLPANSRKRCRTGKCFHTGLMRVQAGDVSCPPERGPLEERGGLLYDSKCARLPWGKPTCIPSTLKVHRSCSHSVYTAVCPCPFSHQPSPVAARSWDVEPMLTNTFGGVHMYLSVYPTSTGKSRCTHVPHTHATYVTPTPKSTLIGPAVGWEVIN